MKNIPLSLFTIFLLIALEIPVFAQKKILIVSDIFTSNQFAFEEGDRFPFKIYGKDKFVKGTIMQINDSIMTLRGNKFSNYFTILADSIKAIKEISSIHVFTRIASACVIVPWSFICSMQLALVTKQYQL